MKKTITNYTTNDKYNSINIKDIIDIKDEPDQTMIDTIAEYKYNTIITCASFMVGFTIGYIIGKIQ